MISICKSRKRSFILITVKKALPVSVRVIKLGMTTLLPGRLFSRNFFSSYNLPSTTLNGSLIALIVPTSEATVRRCSYEKVF